MKKYSYKFLVIDDDLNVCESVEKRMEKFINWKCYGKLASLKEAKEVTQKELPELLFLDWSIKGGNAFTFLEFVEKIENYQPYIIFFTGYQSDHPEIPVELINRFKVKRYLIKPIYENLTEHLEEYINDAEKQIEEEGKKYFWIEDVKKINHKICVQDILCFFQSNFNSRQKTIYLISGQKIEIKSSWTDCEKLVQNFQENFIYANSRESYINKIHIIKKQKPYLWIKNLKIEVTKDKWIEIFDKINFKK